MKLFKNRIIPAFILLFAMLVLTVPMSVFGQNHYQARIYGYVSATIVTSFLLYELFTSFKIKWYYATLFTTVTAFSLFIPFDNLIDLCKPNNNPIDYLLLLKKALKSWESLLIFFIVSILFFIVELNTIGNKSWLDRFQRFVSVFVSVYFIVLSMKFIQYTLYFRWYMTIFVIGISSIVDTGGFFGGKFFGHKWIKTSFTPTISPKKTWEGFIFGIAAGWLCCAGMIFGLHLAENKLWAQILLLIFVPFLAVVGDLYFSYLKRINQTKDYSKILYGHGGILDRFDSVCFVTTFAAIIYSFV